MQIEEIRIKQTEAVRAIKTNKAEREDGMELGIKKFLEERLI